MRNTNTVWQHIPGPESIQRIETTNGIMLLVYPNPASKSIYFIGLLDCGSIFDPIEKLGLAYFTAAMLLRGTKHLSFQQIHNKLESVGANISFNASTKNIWFRGRSLVEDLPMVIEVLADCLLNPSFPNEYVERLRGQLLTALAIRDQDTANVAALEFDRSLFPNHPYGTPVDGFKETIAAITREDLVQYHQRYFGTSKVIFAVSGALPANQMIDIISTKLSHWKLIINPNQPELAEIPPLNTTIRKHIYIPEKSQTNIILGCFAPPRTSEDYLPIYVGNNVLGQFGLYGRIGEAVRTQAGIAYSASSSIQSWDDSGVWGFSAGVNPQNISKAIGLIKDEIKRFIDQGVSQEELDDSVSHLIGRMPLSLESNAGITNAMLTMERFSLGLDYFQKYPRLLQSITPEGIKTAAQKYLDPTRLVIISAGPPEKGIKVEN